MVMISVIVPAYNEERSVKKTIEEIQKVLKKNRLEKGSEIIIVNDGSSDKTKEVSLKCGVKVIDNPSNIYW